MREMETMIKKIKNKLFGLELEDRLMYSYLNTFNSRSNGLKLSKKFKY